jgi:hypothetical protein
LWIEYLTGRRAAGVVAGVIVGFLPFRFAHLLGHLPQITMQFIPLTLYAVERFIDRRTTARAVVLGLMVAGVALSCWYYGYALGIMLPVYVVLRTWRNRAVWVERQWWQGMAIGAAVAAALILPFLVQMLRLTASGALVRSIADMESWSLNVYDLFLPNLMHPKWGVAASRWFPVQSALWVEKAHSLGYAALVLAIIGAGVLRRQAILVALAGTWLVAYAIALGPTVHSGDRQFRIGVPPPVARFAARSLSGAPEQYVTEGVPLPLPALFMYKFVPLTSSMRVMARFSVWCALMTAALAGFGVVATIAAAEKRIGSFARVAVPAAALVVVALESVSNIPTTPIIGRGVDVWLAAQPDDVVVVELPIDQGLRSLGNYWAIQNRRKNFFGWNGDSFPPPIQAERAAALKEFPSPASLAYLKGSPATHVLLTPSQISNWDTMERSLTTALRLEQTIDGVRVYKITR